MLNQTVDSLMPLLSILQQPAFCLHRDGTVFSNPAAAPIAPYDLKQLPHWLGECTALYEQWTRQSVLTFPVTIAARPYSVTVEALADGELFLLSDDSDTSGASNVMAASSQVLRQPLTDLMASTQMLMAALEDQENPSFRLQSASIAKNLYRLTRLAGNLSDYDLLQRGELKARPSLLTFSTDFVPMLEEIADLVAETGCRLELTLPSPQLQIYADRKLLERALLNMLGNAIKHGQPGQTISLAVKVQPNFILLQCTSRCTEAEQAMLSSAFRRTEQRGVLPDPRWGLGLGMLLIRHIAQLHGGTLALEAGEGGTVTATMSLSRKRPAGKPALESPVRMDRSGGLNPRLVELSDVLPARVFELQLP